MIGRRTLRVAGLFAGVGGLERGLDLAGLRTELLCEIDPAAIRVLRRRFPSVPLVPDIRDLETLPDVEIVAAGFPCQDLSQAGRTAGISGRSSGLVSHVFRLIADRMPRWLLLENVPFMLALDRGRAMHYLADQLHKLRMRWAYRVVDTRAFGLPQRRQRVILLASRDEDPCDVLLTQDRGEPEDPTATPGSVPCGFYWTEGNRGLGWAIDSVPTLKGGSTVGIPSPPAIWWPGGEIVTPDIRDAERLQGFPPGWTRPAVDEDGKHNPRWRLVGNAVSVPVARWVGSRLASPGGYDRAGDETAWITSTWPTAAWSDGTRVCRSNVSAWPIRDRRPSLATFLKYPTRPLSERATAGFLARARASSLRFADGFLDGVAAHLTRMRRSASLPAT